MAEWLYHGQVLTEDVLTGFKSFVYCITNNTSGKRYFGKKRLHFTSHKRHKGRKNRIKVVKPSDWQQYWGSSDTLKADIASLGETNFQRDILKLCKSLSEASYYELKYQMDNDVLLNPDRFYNAYVGGRISRKQLGIKELDHGQI